MEPIPGAYPATPTPVLEDRQLASQPQPQPQADLHSARHQHNKLHKPNDPRGHKHTDSGVGLVDAEPLQPSKTDEPRFDKPRSNEPGLNRPSEAIGGGMYARDSSGAPSHSQPQPPTAAPALDRHDDQSHHSAVNGKPAELKADSSRTTDTKPAAHDTTPPYWGHLPKAVAGGIYNTVMGHGSATDDHAERHHLPQKPEAERAHVSGASSELPKGGGIYNTVAGHGSRDEESKRHTIRHTGKLDDTSRDAGMLAAASLPGIAEDPEKEKRLQFAATGTNDFGVAPGFLPETAARDDANLLASTANKPNASSQPPVTSTPIAPHSSHQTNSASPRVFPLSTSHHETARYDSRPDEHNFDTHESGSRLKDGALLTAAGAGTGLAASTMADKPNKIRKHRESSPLNHSGRNSKELVDDRKDGGIIGGALPQRPKDDKAVTPTEPRKGRDEGSPKGEKKHRFLDIFHRHKDDNEKTPAAGPASDHGAKHKDHRKGETAAVAAAGAGLLHRHDGDKQAKHHRSNSVPTNSQPDSSRYLGHTSGSNHAAGGMTVQPQNPNQRKSLDSHHGPRFGNGHAPVPLTRSADRRGVSPPAATAYAAETAAQQPAASEVRRSFGEHAADRFHHNTAMAAGAGLAAGLGAGQFARSHDRSADPTADGISESTKPRTTGGNLYAFENPREPPAAPVASTDAHRTSSSKSSAPDAVTSEPGNYSTLSSGTASGVRTESPHGTDKAFYGAARAPPNNVPVVAPAQRTPSNDDRQSGPYNVLPSGTPSGVKIGPNESRSRGTSVSPSRHDLAKHGDGHYNTLASGTASGITASQLPGFHHHQPDHDEANHSSTRELNREHLAASQPREMGAGAVHATARRSMIEEAESVAPPVPSKDPMAAPSHAQAGPREELHHSAINPALAAAGGAWASKAGASSGLGKGAPGKVVHKCQHCGGDNDISSYFL